MAIARLVADLLVRLRAAAPLRTDAAFVDCFGLDKADAREEVVMVCKLELGSEHDYTRATGKHIPGPVRNAH